MNTTIHKRQNKYTAIRVFILLFLCISLAVNTTAGITSYHGKEINDSIVIKTITNNRNHNARLYPDAANENLLFSARGKRRVAYQLFVFDMDGRLVKQTSVLEKQTRILTCIEKGNYLFEVFSNDLRIENGSIMIK